ncbi:hypothetical protein NDU88_003324 [Pleurodeles waltl]|uniref:Uncharacterized protein n=1 Tax=Pleurodeles waltl TaxID=8319 RepID=A0AAV7UY61_PLEWA|nr:hypothetical protein NDU88_003324 [Pleurodeles waltl]
MQVLSAECASSAAKQAHRNRQILQHRCSPLPCCAALALAPTGPQGSCKQVTSHQSSVRLHAGPPTTGPPLLCPAGTPIYKTSRLCRASSRSGQISSQRHLSLYDRIAPITFAGTRVVRAGLTAGL